MEPHLNNSFSAFNGVKIINKDILYASNGSYSFTSSVYRDVIFKTTNGGNNWGYQMPDTTNGLFYAVADFLNENTGWLINAYTTNGGGPIIYTEIKNIIVEHPTEYQLMQNYPNPFNPSTTIDFYLPHKASVELKVFDISGKTVLRIIDNFQLKQGYHSYKVDDFNSLGLSSGMYFYRLTASDNSSKTSFTETKRLVYLK
ncbi:MAG: T9SS type A sorting domain-containing protein [Ignavibacteriae bacterium]|nr:T9SS type A sorting domain-containing protein [Ignavibacteriota bacterium]